VSKGASGEFFGSPDDYPQSVFKHELLKHYLKPFTGMTGKQDAQGRVMIVDGYAGAGRYDSEDPASAELILQTALAFSQRTLRGFFVEAARNRHARLAAVVEEYRQRGVDAVARRGKIEDHLTEVLARAAEIPLFLFLDPCGAVVPFDTLAGLLRGPRRARQPATEVLVNFSADFTRRTTGVLLSGQHDHHGIARLNTTCGGDWWQEVAIAAHGAREDDTFEAAAEAVVAAYASRLAAASGARHVVVPVRKRPHHQPIYHLVFLTRSPYGEWVFSDALGRARQRWLRLLAPEPDDQEDGLFPIADAVAETVEKMIRTEAADARTCIEHNIRGLIASASGRTLVTNARGVLGEAFGIATDPVVADAVRNLRKQGHVVLREPIPSRVRDYVLDRPVQRAHAATTLTPPAPRAGARPTSGPPAVDHRPWESNRPTA
jgi:three-Cys-motif partner protein